ncbi:MAG: oligosaccharide flippase family protein [Candidatus Rokuibacteriota bacterium]
MTTSSSSPGLRGRTLRSFLLLGAQKVVSVVVTAAGGIALARLLTPEVFGLYAILVFIVTLGVRFSDLGLGAALIQRRDLELTTGLSAAFTATFGLALVLAAAIAVAAPLVARWPGVTSDVTAPVRCLALLVVLASLRMPAMVLLERRLAYLPLTIAETIDTVTFNMVAIAAALAGAGLWSFVLGALAARVANLAVLWTATRWRPTWRWNRRELAPVLKLGVLFQGSVLIGVAGDAVVPTFVTAWSGLAAVGYLNWAATLAFLPLQVVSIAGRVLFPALSSLQAEPARFAEATERALNRVTTILYPAAALLLVGADPVVRLIFGEAWVPAVPAVRCLCLSAIIGGTSTIFVHALYGLGRPDLVFRLNLASAALLWVLTVALVPWLGFVGFAVASASLACAGVAYTALRLRRLVPLHIVSAVRVPLTSSVASAAVLAALVGLWIHDLPSLVFGAAVAVGAYVAIASVIGGAAWRVEFMADWRTVLQG